MFKPSLVCLAGLLLVLLCGCPAADPDPTIHALPIATSGGTSLEFPAIESVEPALNSAEKWEATTPRFMERHADLGIEFVFDPGADERALMVQSTGGGGGWIDFDRDGWHDLYLVQGGNPTHSPAHVMGNRLLRNQAGLHYSDVSPLALPVDYAYGQGMAVGDFDNDGFDDIFISNTGPDVLLQNEGDGTFTDITVNTGMDDRRWGSSAAWFDLDRDGDLDLFVCNYCRYDVYHPVVCRQENGAPAICHPESLDADFSECYENRGDGTFDRVAQKWGLADKPGKALGIVAADFNDDGRPDLFVANDTMANFLYLGVQSGGFSEQGVPMGCAYNTLGQFQANMGVACNDYDGNGFPDLYITTFTNDSNTLFANLGPAGFRDVTRLEGLHAPTLDTLGFGTVMTDLNADGAMDLFIANGHIDDWRSKHEKWKMLAEMFSYNSSSWVKLSAEQVGDFLNQEHLGRAVSMSDHDHDGDTDLLVVHQTEPASLLVNESMMGHWLRVECLGVRSNRRGVGAKVTVRQGARTWNQQLIGGSSYLTTHEPTLFFGIGDSPDPCEVSVSWPDASSPPSVRTVAVNQRVLMLESPPQME